MGDPNLIDHIIGWSVVIAVLACILSFLVGSGIGVCVGHWAI